MKTYAIVSVISDGVRIFKGSPELVFETFKPYLTDAGKAFFTTRMRDQLQPCINDDMLVLLPWDTLGMRLQKWDQFCTKYASSYVSRKAEEYLHRYLGVYLPCYTLTGFTRFQSAPLFGEKKLRQSHEQYISS